MTNSQLVKLLDVDVPKMAVNPQAFQNRSESYDQAKETFEPAEHFFNEKLPNMAVNHEKPEHRLLLLLKAQGLSNTEISQRVGYTEAWLSQLFRQPWARQVLVGLMQDAGLDRVQALLKGAAEDCIVKLIELRDDPDVPPAIQKASADSLLDRWLGKPKQQVEVVQKPTAADVHDIDKELEALKKEEERLLGKN